jgi:hypothetical protein
MNKIDFTQTGGFPFDQSTLEFLQNCIGVASQAASIAGDLAILSGCAVAGDNAGDGYVVIFGEILPFNGGVIQEKVIIVETEETLKYEDGENKPVIVKRHATFGDDGGDGYLWVDFKRNRLDQVWLTGDIKEVDCTIEYMQENFDITGLGIKERTGWAISNGNNNTRDRRGKMSVQYDITKLYANELGKTGGEETVRLTEGQLPKHAHQLDSENVGGGSTSTVSDAFGFGTNGHGNYTGEVGNDEAHNNMSPYIVTLVIQKL